MSEPSNIRSLIALSARENAVLLGIMAAYVAVAMGLAEWFGFRLRATPWFYLKQYAVSYLLIVIAAVLWVLAKERPDRPLLLLAGLPRRWRVSERAIIAAPALLGFAFLFPVFSSMKAAIPAMNPYTWDPLFARMDVWIHGGHAWELLQPVIGYPIVSYLLNGVYHLWLAIFYMVVCAAAIFVEQRALRRQFLIAFALSWALVGNLAATLMASVGPCFYAAFYPDDPYAGLMSYLHQADEVYNLPVLAVQERLLGWAQEGTTGVGRGISAMPSVHVAIACLLMLLGWRSGRGWAIAGTLFFICIMVGSVHLAYHYAVDGYFSLIATVLIWWVAGWLAKLELRRPLPPLHGEGGSE